MSYWCHATQETVIGEPRVLVPIKIRKVVYVAQEQPDPKSDYMQFVGQSEGWEIVKEVPVRQSSAETFARLNPPVVVGVKEVRFTPVYAKINPDYYKEDEDDVKPDVDSFENFK